MKLMPLDRAAAEGIAFSHLTLLVNTCIAKLYIFYSLFQRSDARIAHAWPVME